MAGLQKQPLSINFQMGLDTKTDPHQVSPGKFLALENTIFTKGGLLEKRNGFGALGSLPNTNYEYLSTFRNNLVSVGTSLSAYSTASSSWVTKGTIAPMQLSTMALLRNSSNQAFCDSAIAPNDLVCLVYTESSPSTAYKYVILDQVTGQNIISPTTISTPAESPRVFLLGNYFIILFSQATNLKYISIPVNNPSVPAAAVTLVTNYLIGGTRLAFDGVVSNNSLYISYNATDGGGAIRSTYLNSFLVRQTGATGTSIAAAKTADMVSVCADESGVNPQIWTSFYVTAGTAGYVVARDSQLNSILAATQIIASGTMVNLASVAQSGVVTVFSENQNTYSYGASLPSNFITKKTVTLAGVVSTNYIVARSVGLASKAFLLESIPYIFTAYSSSYQPSYFLLSSPNAADGNNLIAKLAYSNGGGYLTLGLPSVNISGTKARVAYLIKDLIAAANKSQTPASSTPVFTQTGVNLVTFDFTAEGITSSEIGENLHLSGGLLWTYDGSQVVEQGFTVYPDNVIVTTATGAGSITAQDYYYVALYEYTDNQGNIHRSAPSLPVKQTTTTASSTNTIKVPTLRLTYKSLVKIVLYRWSTAQQTYYQVTSLTSPTLNSTTADSVTITDTQADSSIVGNSILYTTGGVIENIGAPATNILTLYKSRLFLVDAEDPNLLWFSKQVIEGTPVEMSDLLTLYVAPTISAQGNTGPITALSAMDDKLILFKKDAIYYLVGTGPDNTGTNNDFSDPVFITSTVGCANPNSIVFIPDGLLFQSDKGIWLLGRDLSTKYLGAPVESFNDDLVLSAISIPGTNQVRFTLDSGTILMFDYFYQQWGTFTGIPGISATLFQDLHTFINNLGAVYQENGRSYLDGSNPVLISFTTSWFQLAGLQGFQRAYFFYLLGLYQSPHQLTVSVAFDFNPAPFQTSQIRPVPLNANALYGDDPFYGSTALYGGNDALEQWRVFLKKQKCESLQITVTESFDASAGMPAGAGLTLSGLNLIVGLKKGYLPLRAKQSVG